MNQTAFEVHLQMHAQGFETQGERSNLVGGGRRREVLHEVETHGAKAGRGQPLKFSVRHIHRHQRHTQVVPAARRDGVFDHAVVKTMHGRLHDHAALDAELAMQRKEHFLGRINRGEIAARSERKLRRRSEHVDMAVTSPRRQGQAGRRGVRVVGQHSGGKKGRHGWWTLDFIGARLKELSA